MDPLRPTERGHSSVYQSANRYAHLCWLRKHGIEAWLVHLLFVEDPTFGRTSRADWESALPQIEDDLGLRGVPVPYATHVFVAGPDPDRIRDLWDIAGMGKGSPSGSMSVNEVVYGPMRGE
jgi:hypothetical protein